MSKRDDLSEALKALPRVLPSEGFEERVLAELARRQRPVSTSWGPQLALAAAVTLSVGGGWWVIERAQVPTGPDRVVRAEQAVAELAALRAEVAALRANLTELQRPSAPTVFAVPGDLGQDVVVDLRPAVFPLGGASGGSAIVPARFERFEGSMR
jgi:hypothetical protein